MFIPTQLALLLYSSVTFSIDCQSSSKLHLRVAGSRRHTVVQHDRLRFGKYVVTIRLAPSKVYISSLLKSFLTPASSIPPPSGSTASIHRTTAIVCFTSFVLIQILPFIPTATSSGKREPRKGSKKCIGSNKLQTSHQVRVAHWIG